MNVGGWWLSDSSRELRKYQLPPNTTIPAGGYAVFYEAHFNNSDVAAIPFPDASFDTITLIAVGGHIPRSKREAEFREFCRLLKVGGHLLMTEGEPITQFILHKWAAIYYGLQGKKDMDTERGMDVEEDYCMPRREIYMYLNTSPLKLINRVKFMWGLNNIYIAQKC